MFKFFKSMSIFKNIRLTYLYITGTKSTLFTAATNGDFKRVKELFKLSKINVNAEDKDRKTPLHYAAEKGHKDVVGFLIGKRATINARDKGDSTPLHYAVEKGRTEIAKLLIENGAKIDARNRFGSTPLHYAATYGRTEIAKLLIEKLIEKEATIDARDENGQTPLHLAVLASHTNIVISLMENKADVNAQDKDRITPLHLAACRKHKDLVIEICKSRLIGAYDDEKAVSSVEDEWKIIICVLKRYNYRNIDSLRGDVIENLENEIALPPLTRGALTACISSYKEGAIEQRAGGEEYKLNLSEIVKGQINNKNKTMISVKSALIISNTKNVREKIIKLLKSEQPPSEQPPRQALNAVNAELQNQEPQPQGVPGIRP